MRECGHEIVELDIPDWMDYVRGFLIIAGNTVRDRLPQFEPNNIECESKLIYSSSKVPHFIIDFVKWIVGKLGRKFERTAAALKVAVKLSEKSLLESIDSHKRAISEFERYF